MKSIRRQYLTEKQVSGMTSMAVSTLRNHRFIGIGIPYVKFGKSVRYELHDVLNHFEERKIIPEDK